MFINLSNHPYRLWDEAQRRCAEEYGQLMDLPFPQIDPLLSDSALDSLVARYAEMICDFPQPTVMLQGEFVFCFRLANLLKEKGIPVVAAVSHRETVEQPTEDGATVKQSVFRFAGFRPY